VGSRPSSRHQPIESTIRRTSRVRLCSALSVSHALDGFLLDQPCASISLRCRVQGSRSRGCLPRPSRSGSRHPLPSRRWRRRLPVARLQRTSRRPQGLAPNRGPQCPAGFLGPHVTRVPSCVFNSCGLVARRPWVRRRAPSARDLHAAGLRVPRVAGPQRIDQSPCCDLSPKRSFPFELSDLRSWLPFPERPISSVLTLKPFTRRIMVGR
jgi:hypothetical protein